MGGVIGSVSCALCWAAVGQHFICPWCIMWFGLTSIYVPSVALWEVSFIQVTSSMFSCCADYNWILLISFLLKSSSCSIFGSYIVVKDQRRFRNREVHWFFISCICGPAPSGDLSHRRNRGEQCFFFFLRCGYCKHEPIFIKTQLSLLKQITHDSKQLPVVFFF